MKSKKDHTLRNVAMIWLTVMLTIAAFAFVNMLASASLIDDIPEGINDALFAGGDLEMAKLLLSTLILFSVVFALAIFKMKPPVILITVFIGVIFLVALSWLQPVVLIIFALLMAIQFSKIFVDWIPGR